MFSSECIEYTIKLIRNVIADEPLCEIPQSVSLTELYQYAKFHKVEAIVSTALDKLDIQNSEEKLQSFKNIFYQNAVISIRQNYYYDMVEKAFAEKGVLFAPMKGSVIKHLYPQSNMRALSDIDIFIGKNNSEAAHGIMEELGFKTLEYDSEVLIHDTYCAGGVHFELHKELMPHIPYFKGVEVCDELEKDIIEENGKYLFSNEAFYTFMIIHIAKHVKHNGIGLRGFIDVWIYLNKYNDELDWEKIDYYMKKSHLEEFNSCVLQLVDYWFKDKTEVPEHIRQFAYLIAENGAVGDAKAMISEEKYTDFKNNNKFRYYINTVFLPLPYMIDKYKILKRYPVLLPFCWIHRIFSVLLFKTSRIKLLKTHFDDGDMELGKNVVDLKQKIGL